MTLVAQRCPGTGDDPRLLRKTRPGGPPQGWGPWQNNPTALEVVGFIVNDTVMGGRSDSELVMSDQAQALSVELVCMLLCHVSPQRVCPDREPSFAARSPSVAVVALPRFDFSRGTACGHARDPLMFDAEPQDRGAFLAMLRSATGVALKIRRSKACLRSDARPWTPFLSKCFPLRIQGCASWKLQLNSRHFSIASVE